MLLRVGGERILVQFDKKQLFIHCYRLENVYKIYVQKYILPVCCLWEKKNYLYMSNNKQLVQYTRVFKYSMSIKNNAFNELFFAEQEYI